MLKTKRYYISSADRDDKSAKTTDFRIQLNNLISSEYDKAIIRKVVLPQTYYNVNSSNYILAWVDAANVFHGISITLGDYSDVELAAELQTLMNANKSVGDVATYTVSINSTTKKFTFSATANFELRCAGTKTIFPLLGFLTTYHRTGASSYTGNFVYNMQPTNIFYLASNIANNDNTFIPSGDRSIVLSIPIKYPHNFGTIICYEPKTPQVIDISHIGYQLTFKLLDDEFNVVDLNGSDINIEIDFMDKH